VLKGREDLPLAWRQQQVLDLQNPDAFDYLLQALCALLDEYDIAYLKWDHNRDVIDASHDDVPAVHGQTLALYRLLDELGARYPRLEIESCASGGGRIDLGVLRRTHRVWASDTNDALERLNIQRWTTLLLPIELIGSHVGAAVAHTTGRHLPLAFRCATALFGSFGVEWNLLDATPDERAALARWAGLYKRVRPVASTGRLVRGDHPDPGLLLTGVVAQDRSEAWFRLAQVATSRTTQQTPVHLTGLDPDRTYVVERVDPPGHEAQFALDGWMLDEGPVRLSGKVLGTLGLQPPVLGPQTARILHLTAE
jgi:alpha-galactosidase